MILIGVDRMVAWRGSGTVVVTYTARMHARMLRSVGCRDVSGRRVSGRDCECRHSERYQIYALLRINQIAKSASNFRHTEVRRRLDYY